MTVYRHPTNDTARLLQMRRSLEAAQLDQSQGRIYVYAETITKLQTFIPQFEAALQAKTQADAVRRQALSDATQHFAQLELQVRATITMISGLVRRQLASTALLRYYQLSERGTMPTVRKREEWVALAEGLLRGDEQAREQGFAGVQTRSALEAALASAQEVLTQLNAAEQHYSSTQKVFTAARAEANRLCQHIYADLRNLLRAETPSYRRQVMRTYGLNFVSGSNEELPPTEESAPMLPGQQWRIVGKTEQHPAAGQLTVEGSVAD